MCLVIKSAGPVFLASLPVAAMHTSGRLALFKMVVVVIDKGVEEQHSGLAAFAVLGVRHRSYPFAQKCRVAGLGDMLQLGDIRFQRMVVHDPPVGFVVIRQMGAKEAHGFASFFRQEFQVRLRDVFGFDIKGGKVLTLKAQRYSDLARYQA